MDGSPPDQGKAKISGFPFKLGKTPGEIDRSSPLVGEHNELILGKYLGINPGEARQLKADGVL